MEKNARETEDKNHSKTGVYKRKMAKVDTALLCLQEDPCVAGRGDQYIEHGGYTWRTLDGADPQGGNRGAPNNGCQCIDTDSTHRCTGGGNNYLPLPAGWVLAPNDATSIAVVAAHGWSTQCPVLADGTAWVSANWGSAGGSPGDSCPVTSGSTYTVVNCQGRVLARCG